MLVTSQGKPLLNTDIALKVLPDPQAEAAGRAESQEHPLTAEMAELCRIYMGIDLTRDLVKGTPPGGDGQLVGVLPQHGLVPPVEEFFEFRTFLVSRL